MILQTIFSKKLEGGGVEFGKENLANLNYATSLSWILMLLGLADNFLCCKCWTIHACNRKTFPLSEKSQNSSILDALVWKQQHRRSERGPQDELSFSTMNLSWRECLKTRFSKKLPGSRPLKSGILTENVHSDHKISLSWGAAALENPQTQTLFRNLCLANVFSGFLFEL